MYINEKKKKEIKEKKEERCPNSQSYTPNLLLFKFSNIVQKVDLYIKEE